MKNLTLEKLDLNDLKILTSKEMKEINGGAWYKCLCDDYIGDGHGFVTLQLETFEDFSALNDMCGDDYLCYSMKS